MDASANSVTARRPLRGKAPAAGEPPLAAGRLEDLPAGLAAAIGEAIARIDEWTPKGVHFGWEKAFKNKGKFPASMDKAQARALVCRLLREAPLQVFANRRAGQAVAGELRIVAAAQGSIGTRGQRAVRIVLARDAAGYRVDNAFPVIGG